MNHPTTISGRSGFTRQGFTLTEMLVAIGAMALLSLGVAQVFSLTTKTVAAGRRLSNLNAVASATERQMRADFSSITSRGPIVIRNQKANNGGNVESFPADPSPRARRIDELVVFTTGRTTSLQQPVTADGSPVGSNEAMLYYGHGARQNPLAPGASGFTNAVNISDTNVAAPALGVNTGPGGSKVNQYASEWTLVRRAFVLAPPSPQTGRIIPAGQGFAAPTAFDNAKQISGLPAAPSPSRVDSLNWQSPSMGDATLRAGTPALSSGVVDIIAMDLRSVAAQLADTTAGAPNLGDVGNLTRFSNQINVGTTGAATAAAQHAWMRTLLPADSDNGRRIRVEPTAPDFLNLNGGAANPVQRSDQLMLTSGAFLPRCSEFIVEYSFGKAHGAGVGGEFGPIPANVGDIYWHGLNRKTGFAGGGTNYGQDVVRYEEWVTANGNSALTQTIRRREKSGTPTATTREIKILPALIEPTAVNGWGGGGNWTLNPAVSSYAFFGLNDPYYAPMMPPTLALYKDVNGNGLYDWADGDVLQEPETIAWARPTMIRITLTLCDPTDPSIEQTFQFIFDLPKDVRTSEM